MFVINPDPYSLPCYRIGPFQTRDLSLNHNLPESNQIDKYMKERFGDKEFIYTINGRKAMNSAFLYYNLKKDDVVTILTTTNNFYISSCVTQEIEKFCKWSRKFEVDTKLIFVNHEFGYPYPELLNLKKYNLPIIEDCAGSFLSKDSDNSIGNVGDFVIYSFPKMFPLQIGGLLVSNIKDGINVQDQAGVEEISYIKNILSSQINSIEKLIDKRLSNYSILKSYFESLDFSERFELEKGVIPSVFMFKKNEQNINFPELKKYFYAHGVQCSVFFGEEAFFIPVHQALTRDDLEYFYNIMKSFLNTSR